MKLVIVAIAIVAVLSSCVSAGFADFATAQPAAPGHLSIGLGAEESGVTSVPDVFSTARLGIAKGLDVGVRVGLGTLLGDARYKLPLGWKKAAVAVGIGGGANFNHKVAQLEAPITFSYRFNKTLAATASQASTLYLGKYSGFALSGGLGLKVSLGRFFLFPEVVAGYISPSGGDWGAPGGSIGQLGTYTIQLAKQGTFASLGLALGFDF